MRLIDADDLLIELGSYHIGGIEAIINYDERRHRNEWTEGLHTAWRTIDDAPTIDAEPIRHGHWIATKGDSRLMCSVCKWKGDVPTFNGKPIIWEYCPSCGAKMDGMTD